MTPPQTPATAEGGWTAGPWMAEAINSWNVWASDCKVAVTIAVGQAEFYRVPDHPERVANARLIAAAPELFESLKDCAARLRVCAKLTGTGDEFIDQMMAPFDVALNKALGK